MSRLGFRLEQVLWFPVRIEVWESSWGAERYGVQGDSNNQKRQEMGSN